MCLGTMFSRLTAFRFVGSIVQYRRRLALDGRSVMILVLPVLFCPLSSPDLPSTIEILPSVDVERPKG
jgi:hypothetical protein